MASVSWQADKETDAGARTFPPAQKSPGWAAEVGFVTGLAAEAALLRGFPLVACLGAGWDAAEAAANALIGSGARALVSFGVAAGLDPALGPGALLVPRRVVGDGREFAADPALTARLGGPTCDCVAASRAVVATRAEKAALFAATGAAGLDMESGAVADCAARAGLGFAVLRAVCDTAEETLPRAALRGMTTAGTIDGLAVIGGLARRPGDLGPLLRLASHAAQARRALAAQTRRWRFSDSEHG